MSDVTFFSVLIGAQVVLVLLDVVDRFLPAHEERRADGARPAAIGFVGVVLVVYFAMQAGLSALLPGPRAVVNRVVAGLGGGAGTASVSGVAVAVLVGLYAGGLVDYLMHRFVSHSRVLFFTHEYHHLPSEVFLLMPGLAARPFAVVATFPVVVGTALAAYGTLAVLGEPLADPTPMQLLLIAHVLLLVTSHSSFLRRFRGVHRVISVLGLTTAREHLLHHTTDLKGNFANLTTVWDRAFGTYLDPERVGMQGRTLGLAYDQDWLGAVTLSLVKLPASVRARFDVGRWCNLGTSPSHAPRP